MEVGKPTEQEVIESQTWPIWEKEESEFEWEYNTTERCMIIEGKAEVTSEAGEKISFGKGDFVIFEEGLKCKWKISEKIKKHYKFG
jgi:uncharacterized protein